MSQTPEIRVRDAPVGDCRVTAVAFHPTEPFVVAGLASGLVCICACRTDALTAQVEHERANRCSEAAEKTKNADPKGRFPYVGALASAAGWRLLRVLELPLRSGGGGRGESAPSSEVVQHANFLVGREDDLISDLELPNSSTKASGGDGSGAYSALAQARHLVVLVTNMNSVLVVDVMQNTLLRFWEASTGKTWVRNNTSGQMEIKYPVKEVSSTSPFHEQNIITQVATYGALLFCVIAKREAVERVNHGFHADVARLQKSMAAAAAASASTAQADRATSAKPSASLEEASMDAASRTPELVYTEHHNHYLFVCHLGFTNPFAKPHKSTLGVSKGAYIITPKGKHNKLPIAFIRVHPFAPIVMVVTARSVRVYAIKAQSKAIPYAVLQKPVELDDAGASAGEARVLLTGSSTLPWLVDADFLPTAVVASSASSAPSSVSLANLSVALLTPRRLSIVDCSFSSEDSRIHSHTSAATSGAAKGNSASTCFAPRERAYATPVNGGLRYQRLYTWLGSPSTVVVQQSSRQLLEYTEGDVLPLTSRLLTVCSTRSLPRRCGYAWYLAPAAAVAAGGGSGGEGTGQSSGKRPAAAVRVCYASRSHRLPLWGLQDSVPLDQMSTTGSSAAGANPIVDAAGLYRVVFSSPTHVADWGHACLPSSSSSSSQAKQQAGPTKASGGYHIASVMADTSSIDASSICFTVAIAENAETDVTSQQQQKQPSQCVLAITRVLGTSPVTLVTFDHSFYFVGSREQASNVFLVGGLVYLEKVTMVKQAGAAEDESEDARTASVVRTARLQAALVCCPAAPHVVAQAAEAVTNATKASRAGASSESTKAALTALQETTLARYASVYPVPVPWFASIDGANVDEGAEKTLLSISFQLTNDSQVVPCVWSLWAPATGPTQLVMQRFAMAEDRVSPMWSAPQCVSIQNQAYQNPTQIFSLTTVGGTRCTWPLEPSIVGQLLLFYEESNVLVLATVERGSRYVVSTSSYGRMLFATEESAPDYGTATAAEPMSAAGNAGRRAQDGGGELHLIAQAAVELPEWGRGGGQRAGPLQLTATLSSDSSAVHVAVASRRCGFALVEFPVIGRRTDGGGGGSGGGASGSGVATLVKERVLCAHRWSVLEPGTTEGSGGGKGAYVEDEDELDPASSSSAALANLSPGQRAIYRSQQREARDQRCAPRDASWNASTSPVSLFRFVVLASGADVIASTMSGMISHGTSSEAAGGGVRVTSKGGSSHLSGTPDGEGRVVSFLLIQRFRRLFAVHSTGHVTLLCPAINNCVPIGVHYTISHHTTTTAAAAAAGEQATAASQAPPIVPPLPLAKLNSATAATSSPSPSHQPQPFLRLSVQYGDYAGLLSFSDRCRQRYTESFFARHGAPRLPVQGPDGVVAFVPGSATKQSKARRSAASPTIAAEALSLESHLREVLHLREQAMRQGEIADMREGIYACVRAWVTAGGAAMCDGLESTSSSRDTPPLSVVRDMDITDPLRAAVVRMRAADTSRAITQLVTASALLTSAMRTTFAALDDELNESVFRLAASRSAPGEQAPSLLGGDLMTARVLSMVPLASVTECLAYEFCRAKLYDEKLQRDGVKGSDAVAKKMSNPVTGLTTNVEALRQSRVALQRWWLLVMQSYVLVNALNDGERDRSEVAVQRVLAVDPDPFTSKAASPSGGGGGGGVTTDVLGEVLLYCPIPFQPKSLWSAVKTATPALPPPSDTKVTPVVDPLMEAVLHALTLLGGRGGAPGTPVHGVLEKMLASLSLDGAHWVTSVLLDRLYYNLEGIAQGNSTSSPSAPSTQITTTAQDILQTMGKSSEVQTAAAVVEVAAATIATLKGSGYAVPGASYEKMTAAVAVSVSRRKRVMGVATPRALGGQGEAATPRGADVGMSALLRRLDEKAPVQAPSTSQPEETSRPDAAKTVPADVDAAGGEEMPQDVLLRPPGDTFGTSDELRTLPDTSLLARLDRMRAVVYAIHWRTLYDLSAYTALYWQSPASSASHKSAQSGGKGSAGRVVPLQISRDPASTSVTQPSQRTLKNAATTTTQATDEKAAAQGPPDTSPHAAKDVRAGGTNSVPSRQHLAQEIDSAESGYAPPTPQQIQAMLDREEEAMRVNYLNAFSTSTTTDPAVVNDTAGGEQGTDVRDDLAELQKRIAAPPSVTTRMRGSATAGTDATTTTASPAPLRAEDFFERMANSTEGEDRAIW